MASVSSLGIGSGLQLDTLLTNLETAEKGRLKPISAQQSSFTAKLTGYGSLKAALEKFQTANTALNDATLFKSTSVTSTSTDLSVTTAAGAAPGIYKINVTQLAQAQSLTMNSIVSDAKTMQGNGNAERTLEINFADPEKKPLAIKLTNGQTSLEGIRDAINDANGGVNASIVKVNDKEFQLVLTSADSGEMNKMTVSVTGDDTLNGMLSYDGTNSGGMKQIVPAQDAKLNVNGIDITRSSNTITDAPQGVTLNLSKLVSDVTVTVNKSNDKSTAAIKAWVDAYNSLVDTMGSLTKYTAVDAGNNAQDASNGVLLGDNTIRTIQTGIRGQFSSGANDGNFQTLSQMGITQDAKTGKLKIDDDKLKKALTDKSVDVQKLLVGDGKETGVTTKIGSLVKGYLADDGIIDTAQDSINATLKKLTKQYVAVSNSIDDTVARYKTQFTQLDTMMSKLNSTSSYLTQQFSAMNNS